MRPQTPWWAVRVRAGIDAVDAVESAFNVLDADGVEVDSLRMKDADDRVIVGYFTHQPDAGQIESVLRKMAEVHGLGVEKFDITEPEIVEDADWLAEWKKNWKPTVTGRFTVAPPWSEVDADEYVIRIDPSMAFGTGTHETTRMCLELVEQYIRPGDSVIDVGTGTGILAIAAGMLRASSVIGYETDEDSVPIAKENIAANPTPASIEVIDGPLPDDAVISDVVVANMTLDVIDPILDLLLAKAKRVVILSGILASQTDEIKNGLARRGYSAPNIKNMGEWIAVAVEKA